MKDEQLKSKDDLLKLAHEQAKEKDQAQYLALSEIVRLNKKLLPPSPSETVRNVDTNGYQPGSNMDTNVGNHASDVDNNLGTSGYQGGTINCCNKKNSVTPPPVGEWGAMQIDANFSQYSRKEEQ